MLLALSPLGHAAETESAPSSFFEKLSPEEKKTLDLSKLAPDQIIALDAAVQKELRLAREGGVSAFAGTFSQRRSAAERERTGLDLLSVSQRETLDTVVAHAMATPPAFSYRPARATGSEVTELNKRALEVHGSVSFTVGGGSGGRSFYGGEVETTLEDPDHRFALSVGYSEYHFKGGGFGYDNGYGCGGVYGTGRGPLRGW